MKTAYDWIVRLGVLLAVVGALNWGLVGLFEWNLVGALFGDGTALVASTLERVLYVLVGVGGIIAIPMIGGTLRRYGVGSPTATIRSTTRDEYRRAA